MGKKIIMILLSAVFIFTMSEQVRAAEISTNGGSVSVPVRYTVDNTAFTITIPTVIWAGTSETEFEITAGNINLRPDEEIQVFIKEGCDEQSKIKLCIPCVGLPSFAVVPGLFCKGSMVASCF